MTDQLHNLLLDNILAGGTDSLEGEIPNGRTLRRMAKRRMARVGQQEHLRDSVGEMPVPGESVHIVSEAKYDFATWIPEIIGWIGKTDVLYCSTWTLSRPNAQEIFEIHDAGQVKAGQLHFLTGLYFKRREAAVYSLLLQGIAARGGRYKAFENHAKVLLLANASQGTYLTVEGSANLTANPRLEQYVLTNDRELYEFHRAWMEEAFASQSRKGKSRAKRTEVARSGFSCRRAGLGVMTCRNDPHSRRELIREKLGNEPSGAVTTRAATELVSLIREWAPTLPPRTVVTCPPQGASWPRTYLAEQIAKHVATSLTCPFETLLTRTDQKTHHHPMAALAQSAFTAKPTTAETVIVVDDLLTSGATMKLSLQAIRDSGKAAFGFAYNGS